MRDPDGSRQLQAHAVVRHLIRPLEDGHFLRSDLARHWQERGWLVPYRIADARTVVADRLAFVSQPVEWCDAQLHDAAVLTLQLQREAVAAGYELKDAPAWNVIFAGAVPVFCDLLSVVPLRARRWWAAGQFARHFIVPLLLSRRRGLNAYLAFRAWRDGVPPPVARRMLGPGRYLTRYWPLVADGPARSGPAPEEGPEPRDAILRFRDGLHSTLDWMLRGVKPRESAVSTWRDYESCRDHYDEHSLAAKRAIVGEWLERLAPGWVADLGCNTGEFSRMALAVGAEVVAIDADHDSVQRLYRAHPQERRLHPLVAVLDDLPGGCGWEGGEHPGLMERLEGRFDAVLMLALVHHLAVAAAVPLERVAVFAARLSRSRAIVEWIGEDDPQLRLLCAQRQRTAADFGIERQRAAFEAAGFIVEAERPLPGTARSMALLKKAP